MRTEQYVQSTFEAHMSAEACLLAAGWEAGTAFGSAANVNFHEPIYQRMVYYCRWHWRRCHESSKNVAAQSAQTKTMIEINDRDTCQDTVKLELAKLE